MEKFTCGASNKSGDFSIFASVHGNAFVFNSVSGVMVGSFRVANKAVLCVDVSESGEFVLFACDDNHVYVYEVERVIDLFIGGGRRDGERRLGELVRDGLKGMELVGGKWKEGEDSDGQAELSVGDFLIGGVMGVV